MGSFYYIISRSFFQDIPLKKKRKYYLPQTQHLTCQYQVGCFFFLLRHNQDEQKHYELQFHLPSKGKGLRHFCFCGFEYNLPLCPLRHNPKAIQEVTYSLHQKRQNDVRGQLQADVESYMNVLNAKYGDFDTDLTAKKKNGETKSRFAPGGLPVKIETFTPHQLRHTYASLLYKAGIDVLTAKSQLGHADIKTTLNIYTHLDAKFKLNSMAKLNDYLSTNNATLQNGV